MDRPRNKLKIRYKNSLIHLKWRHHGKMGRPSEKWYRLFMQWHPELKYQMSQALAREWCGVSFTDIATWFEELKEFILASNHPEILNDPSRIYNCDETGAIDRWSSMSPVHQGLGILWCKWYLPVYIIPKRHAYHPTTRLGTYGFA